MNKTKVIFKRMFSWFLHQRDKIRFGRRYLKIKRMCMLMKWNLRSTSKVESIFFVIYIIISVLVLSNIVVAIGEDELTPLIFELAKIFAIVGGLVLAGGFFATSSQNLKFEMRRVGTLYLLATISFVILGLSFPIYALEIEGTSHYIFMVVMFLSLIIGTVSFSLATSWLTMIIPKLLRKQ